MGEHQWCGVNVFQFDNGLGGLTSRTNSGQLFDFNSGTSLFPYANFSPGTVLESSDITVFRTPGSQRLGERSTWENNPARNEIWKIDNDFTHIALNWQVHGRGILNVTSLVTGANFSNNHLDLADARMAVLAAYSNEGRRTINIEDSAQLIFGDGRAVVANPLDPMGFINNVAFQGNSASTLLSINDHNNVFGDQAQSLGYNYSGTYGININMNHAIIFNNDGTGGNRSFKIDHGRNATGVNFYLLDPNDPLFNPVGGAINPNHAVLTVPSFLGGRTVIANNAILQLGDGTVGSFGVRTLQAPAGAPNQNSITSYFNESNGNGMIMTRGNIDPIRNVVAPSGQTLDTIPREVINNGQIIVNNTIGARDTISTGPSAGVSPEIAAWMNANMLDGISGTGSLIQAGNLPLTLGGGTTYSGFTQINNDRTLYLKNSLAGISGLPNSAVRVGNNALFDISQGNSIQLIGSISGQGTTALGSTTLQIGNALSSGPDVTYDGVLRNGGIANPFAVGGGIIKSGDFRQTLAGVNTFNGSTRIQSGRLALAPTGDISSSSGVFLQPETVAVNTATTTREVIVNRGNVATFSRNPADIVGVPTSQVTGTASATDVTLGDTPQPPPADAVTVVRTAAGANTRFTVTTVSTAQSATTSTPVFEVNGDHTIKDLAGTIHTQIQLNSGNLTFGTANSTQYSGDIIGTGGLTKQGAGAFVVDGNNTFSGPVLVSAGTMVNNSTLGRGAVTVGGGTQSAMLTGTGSYGGSVTINDKGTLARLGTLDSSTAIAGDLTFNSGSRLLVRYETPLLRDTFTAQGNVQINGGTFELTIPGAFTLPAAGQVIPIVTSQGGNITGQFSNIVMPQAAALNFTVSVADPNVNLVANQVIIVPPATPPPGTTGGGPAPTTPGQPSTPGTGTAVPPGGSILIVTVKPRPYDDFAQTTNQRNTAHALENERSKAVRDDMNTIIGNLNTLPSGEALQAAFDQIAPLQYGSLSTIAFNQNNVQGLNLRQRFTEIRNGSTGLAGSINLGTTLDSSDRLNVTERAAGMRDGNGVDATANASKDKAKPDIFSNRPDNPWGVFLTGTVDYGKAGFTTEQSPFDFDTGWLTLGSDYRLSPHITIGGYAAYAKTSADFGTTGSVGVDSAKFGLYAQWQQHADYREKGGLYGNTSIGGSFNSYDLKRSMTFGAISRDTRARPSGTEFTGSVGTGYDVRLGSFTVGPFAEARYTSLGVESFTETGADALNLEIQSQQAQSLRFTLGTSATWRTKLGKIPLQPEARLAWQYESLDNARAINSRLANGAGSAFDIYTQDAGRSNLLAGAGITATLRHNLVTFVHYDAEIGREDLWIQQATIGMRWDW